MTACYSAIRFNDNAAAMFFQLSLPATAAASDAVDDTVLPELAAAGTLTIKAPQGASSHEHVARLLAARLREPKEALRVRVPGGSAATVTFTASPLGDSGDHTPAHFQ